MDKTKGKQWARTQHYT